MFGYLGLPALGIRGAAVATIISQALLLAAGVTLLKVLPLPVRFRFRNLVLNPAAALKVLAIGFPAALANRLNPVRLAVLNILVAWWFLEAGVAGVAVGYRIEVFAFLPALGYAVAALALVGQNLEAGKLERVGRSWRTALVSAFATGTLLGVAAALARGLVVAVFTDDAGVAAYARSYLATVPLTFGVVGATVVAISALQRLASNQAFARRADSLGAAWSTFYPSVHSPLCSDRRIAASEKPASSATGRQVHTKVVQESSAECQTIVSECYQCSQVFSGVFTLAGDVKCLQNIASDIVSNWCGIVCQKQLDKGTIAHITLGGVSYMATLGSVTSQRDSTKLAKSVLDHYPAILRTTDVLALLRISRTTLWRRVRDGEFPPPVRLGGTRSRAVGWRRDDVERWLESRPLA